MRVLSVSLKRREAITVDRVTVGRSKLAYVICADKKLQYKKGRSRIVYIGTTKTGIHRVAQSAATKSDAVLSLRGVNRFTVHIVTCTPRKHVKTWHKLERALILSFRETFGEVPKRNTHGKNTRWAGEDKLFRKQRLTRVIDDLS